MAAINVTASPNLRDIRFEFDDSCNCCGCAPRKARDTDPVFVTKDGTLERFKRVSRPSFSHKISHERVRDIIRLRLSPMTVETEIVLLRLQDIADIDFDAEIEGRRPLTLEKIIRINAAIEKVLSEA